MTSHRIESTATQLMARSRADSGIDIIDSEVEEAVERLLQSLNTEAELHQAGAIAMEERILRILKNRLRMQRDIARHPEILEQKIDRPLILTGAGRTGSTKLHKLLAASGDFIHLTFWQGHSLSLHTGERNEDPTPRIREADDYVRWFNTHSPQAKTIHEFATHEPEEETLIFEHSGFGLYMIAFAFIPSFIQWTVQRQPGHYAFFKRGLQYLQWQFHEGESRRWLLKTPMHFSMEPLLAEFFPDATFVVTHRNPVSTLSSQSSLLDYYYEAYSDVKRKETLGQMLLQGQTMAMQQLLTGRDGNPELKSLDIGYSELTKNADKVVEKIYAHIGIPLSQQARKAMRDWEQENSQHKHGVHSHTLQTYGLTTELVESKLAPYMERFKHCF